MSRSCGTCTLCCKLMGVVELNKPANKRCVHCDHTSCMIYETRPETCRVFECLWLVSGKPDMPNGKEFMSDELRPDKVHVLFWFPEEKIKFMAFSDRPDEVFPRADVIVQEDGDYFVSPGDSRTCGARALRVFLAAIERSGLSVCFVNGNRRKMICGRVTG